MNETELALLLRLKRAAILFIFLAWRGPSRAKTISELLEIDYTTTRKYLAELAELGMVERVRAGWYLSEAGENAIKPRLKRDLIAFSPITTTTLINPLINQEEVVVVEKVRRKSRLKRDQTALSEHAQDNLRVMAELGISSNARTERLAGQEWVGEHYIRSHVAGLRSEDTKGLAILRMEMGEDPAGEQQQGKEYDKYINGEYSEFVEH